MKMRANVHQIGINGVDFTEHCAADLTCGICRGIRGFGINEVDELALLALIADNLTSIRCVLRGQDPAQEYFVQTDLYVKKPVQEAKPMYKFASSEEFKEIWNNG